MSYFFYHFLSKWNYNHKIPIMFHTVVGFVIDRFVSSGKCVGHAAFANLFYKH